MENKWLSYGCLPSKKPYNHANWKARPPPRPPRPAGRWHSALATDAARRSCPSSRIGRPSRTSLRLRWLKMLLFSIVFAPFSLNSPGREVISLDFTRFSSLRQGVGPFSRQDPLLRTRVSSDFRGEHLFRDQLLEIAEQAAPHIHMCLR